MVVSNDLIGVTKEFYQLGLIGHPVSHSLSPLLHGAALSFCRLSGSYDLIDIEPPIHARQLTSLFDEKEYCGLNVTIPHKQAVLPYMHRLSEDAQCVRAVNTIRLESDGTLTGHNTDLMGFQQAFEALLKQAWQTDEPAGKLAESVVYVIGAGGAARSALWALSRLGAGTVCVLARKPEQLETIVAECNWDGPTKLVPKQITSDMEGEPVPHVLINTAPIGLAGNSLPQWLGPLLKDMSLMKDRHVPVVYDMVYSRGRLTPVVHAAGEYGIVAEDGLNMLIAQAALAFHYWTGRSVAPAVMASALDSQSSTY